MHIQKLQQLQDTRFCADRIRDNDVTTRAFTGLPTWPVFWALHNYLKEKALTLRAWRGKPHAPVTRRGPKLWEVIPVIDQLFFMLVHLRQGMSAGFFCRLIGVPPATYSRMFAMWIRFLASLLKSLFPLPSCARSDRFMPQAFKSRFPNTRIIIDCFEMTSERASSFINQAATSSNYKSRNTFKVLVGVTPRVW